MKERSSKILNNMKRLWKQILAFVIAVIIIAGSIQYSQAATYTLMEVSTFSGNTSAYKDYDIPTTSIYITGLDIANCTVVSASSGLSVQTNYSLYNLATGSTSTVPLVVLMRLSGNKSDTTQKNSGSITLKFTECGYDSTGTQVDMQIKISSISVNMSSTTADNQTYISLFYISSDGSKFCYASARYGEKNYQVKALKASYEITFYQTGTSTNASGTYLFTPNNIDYYNADSGKCEYVSLSSGFDNKVYVSKNCLLNIESSNSKYSAPEEQDSSLADLSSNSIASWIYYGFAATLDGSKTGKFVTKVATSSVIALTNNFSGIETNSYVFSAETGGRISPSGTKYLHWGNTKSYTVTANTGYKISCITEVQSSWQVTYSGTTYTISRGVSETITTFDNVYSYTGTTASVYLEGAVTATFEKIKYNIEYDNNEGSGSISTQNNITYGNTVTLSSGTAFSKTGYTLTGWNTAADGSGTSYSLGQSVSNLTTQDGVTITLYAQWSANSYKITYNSNYTSVDSSKANSTTTQSVEYDSTVTIASNSFDAPNDYVVFTGWNTKADGTGTTYTAGTDVTVSNTNSATAIDVITGSGITLYAQWATGSYDTMWISTGNVWDPDNYDSGEEQYPASEGYTGYWTIVDEDTWYYTFYVDDLDEAYLVWEDAVAGLVTDADGYSAFSGDYYATNPYELEDGTIIATITNSNTTDVGSLTITKTLYDEDENAITDDDTEFKFTVTLTDSSGNALSGTSSFSGITFTDGVSETITLAAGETVTISNIPAGYNYSVEEVLTDSQKGSGYSIYSPSSGVITGTIPSTFTGSETLYYSLNTDGSYITYNDNYVYYATNSDKETLYLYYSSTEKSYVTITEDEAEELGIASQNSSAVSAGKYVKNINADTVIVSYANFYNQYKESDYGSLRIEKYLIGDDLTEDDYNEPFTIYLTLYDTNGNTVSGGTYCGTTTAYTREESTDTEYKKGETTSIVWDTGGTATVTVTGNSYVVIGNIPAGYKVDVQEKISSSDWALKYSSYLYYASSTSTTSEYSIQNYSDGTTDSDVLTVYIWPSDSSDAANAVDRTAVVTFTNEPVTKSKLIIEKKAYDEDGNAYNTDDTFTVTIEVGYNRTTTNTSNVYVYIFGYVSGSKVDSTPVEKSDNKIAIYEVVYFVDELGNATGLCYTEDEETAKAADYYIDVNSLLSYFLNESYIEPTSGYLYAYSSWFTATISDVQDYLNYTYFPSVGYGSTNEGDENYGLAGETNYTDYLCTYISVGTITYDDDTTSTTTQVPLDGTYGDVTFDDGTATVEIAVGQTITIDDIPGDDWYYSVVEVSADNYTISYSRTTTDTTDTREGITNISDSENANVTITVTITNTYTGPAYGNLYITKEVSYPKGATDEQIEEINSFEYIFTITLCDSSKNLLSGYKKYGDVIFVNGVSVSGTTIAAGETISIEDIPKGYQYTVTEAGTTNSDYDYSVTWSASSDSSASPTVTTSGVSGTISENTNITITATNTIELPVSCTLVIEKILTDSHGNIVSGQENGYVIVTEDEAEKLGIAADTTGLQTSDLTVSDIIDISEDDALDGTEDLYYSADEDDGYIQYNGKYVYYAVNSDGDTYYLYYDDSAVTYDAEFTITITFKDKGNALSGTEVIGGYVFTNGVLTTTITPGEVIVISGIEAEYDYTVTETIPDELADYYSFSSISVNGTLKSMTTAMVTGTLVNDAACTVTITNEYTYEEPNYTDLILQKETDGWYSEDTNSYTFYVYLTGLTYGVAYNIEYTDSGTGSTVDVNSGSAETVSCYSDGTAYATIVLKSGQTATFKNLPENCTYQISEKKGDYKAAYEITNTTSVGSIVNSGYANTSYNKVLSTYAETLESDSDGNVESNTVVFTNTIIQDQDLYITKYVTKGSTEEEFEFTISFSNLVPRTTYEYAVGTLDDDGTFTASGTTEEFLASTGGSYTVTITLSAGETCKFYSLPIGHIFNVTETGNDDYISSCLVQSLNDDGEYEIMSYDEDDDEQSGDGIIANTEAGADLSTAARTSTSTIIKVIFYNSANSAKARIAKLDENGNYLGGAVFSLYKVSDDEDGEDELIQEGITTLADEEGNIIYLEGVDVDDILEKLELESGTDIYYPLNSDWEYITYNDNYVYYTTDGETVTYYYYNGSEWCAVSAYEAAELGINASPDGEIVYAEFSIVSDIYSSYSDYSFGGSEQLYYSTQSSSKVTYNDEYVYFAVNSSGELYYFYYTEDGWEIAGEKDAYNKYGITTDSVGNEDESVTVQNITDSDTYESYGLTGDEALYYSTDSSETEITYNDVYVYFTVNNEGETVYFYYDTSSRCYVIADAAEAYSLGISTSYAGNAVSSILVEDIYTDYSTTTTGTWSGSEQLYYATLDGAYITYNDYYVYFAFDQNNTVYYFIADSSGSYRVYKASDETVPECVDLTGEAVTDVENVYGYSEYITGLTAGDYYFIETAAPDGYYVSDDVSDKEHSFTITEDLYGTSITVKASDKSMLLLASSGGLGILCIIIISIAGITCTVIIISRRRRRKNA